MNFHFLPGFVLPKEQTFTTFPKRLVLIYPIIGLTPIQSFTTSPKKYIPTSFWARQVDIQNKTLGGGRGGRGKNWEVSQ